MIDERVHTIEARFSGARAAVAFREYANPEVFFEGLLGRYLNPWERLMLEEDASR